MFSAEHRRSRRETLGEENVAVRQRELGVFTEEGGDIGADSEGHATGIVNSKPAARLWTNTGLAHYQKAVM